MSAAKIFQVLQEQDSGLHLLARELERMKRENPQVDIHRSFQLLKDIKGRQDIARQAAARLASPARSERLPE